MVRKTDERKMINYKHYYLKGFTKKDFFDWCLENKLHKRTTLDFSSRMQLVFTGFVETESVTAIVAHHNNEVAGLLLCENRIIYNKGKIYNDPSKFAPIEEEVLNWGFYNLGVLNIFVKPKFRNQGIAKEMIKRIEKIRLNKLANINDENWFEGSKPLFEAQELSFEIGGKYFKNSYVSTGRPEDKYSYRQIIHSLTVKSKDKTGCKEFNKEEFKTIDLEIETEFKKPIKKQKSIRI